MAYHIRGWFGQSSSKLDWARTCHSSGLHSRKYRHIIGHVFCGRTHCTLTKIQSAVDSWLVQSYTYTFACVVTWFRFWVCRRIIRGQSIEKIGPWLYSMIYYKVWDSYLVTLIVTTTNLVQFRLPVQCTRIQRIYFVLYGHFIKIVSEHANHSKFDGDDGYKSPPLL